MVGSGPHMAEFTGSHKQCWTGQDTDLRTILYNIWDKAKVGEE